MRCIRAALGGLAAGSRVLDLPSGTGRLLPVLVEMGFLVTEADSSPHMIEQARKYAETQGLAQGTEFRVEDAFATRFENDVFEAILCNRLFHHFREAEVRRQCLRELSRICRGPIVVSFFCSSSLGALAFHGQNWLRRRTPTDRIPIPRRQFVEDAEAAGLRVVRTMAARPWISKQWYAVLERAKGRAAPAALPRSPAAGQRGMTGIPFVTCASETLVGGGISLSRDRFGEKVLELANGRIVKLFRRKRFLSSNTLFPYAKRFVRVARELIRREIPTVEVLGFYKLPDISRHAVVYRKIKGETLRAALTKAGAPELLLARLSQFLASLHQKGVYFRSLHFANVLLSPPERLTLIDVLDTKFRPCSLRLGLRARNFRHLIRYQVDRQALTDFGVERFVHGYLAAAGLSARRQKRFLRRLVRVDDFFAGCGG